MHDLTALRKEYTQDGLDESALTTTPIELFDAWLRIALENKIPEPYAMTLATATPDGRPSARTVLLRQYDPRGLVYFTNYESRKGKETAANPHGALLFFWAELERQVRIEGRIEKTSDAESDDYHFKRPVDSRLSAVASPQSEIIASREVIEARVKELAAKYPDGAVPRPDHWGGYRFVPEYFEFWQGRAGRTHDRLFYRLAKDGSWKTGRLAP